MRIASSGSGVNTDDDGLCARMCALTRKTATTAAIAACVAISLLGCGKQSPPAAIEKTPVVSVMTDVATEATLTERLEAGGVVTAATSATIASRIAAPVTSLRV